LKKYLKLKRFTVNNIPPQVGKNILITGANSGLGFEAAKVLAMKGANVTIACRDEQKGKEALNLLSNFGEVHLKILDLASLKSINEFHNQLEENKPIDVLINNAGVMSIKERTFTEDGLETQMGVNHLGHFALTHSLLPFLEKSENPRVVTVSSIAAYKTKLDLENLNSEKYYMPFGTYKQSKLANIFFANELGWRYPWLTSLIAHPGVSHTEIGRNMETAMQHIFSAAQNIIGHSTQKGALPILYAAIKSNLQSGSYFGPEAYSRGAVARVPQPKEARDYEKAEKFWEISKKLVRLEN